MSSDQCRDRVRHLIEQYRRQTGQPRLGVRGLSTQMRAAGVHISHGTLHNLLSGATTPDRSTLRALADFFGVNEYYFDTDEPRSAEIMGRIGRLDPAGLDAVEKLLCELDDRNEDR